MLSEDTSTRSVFLAIIVKPNSKEQSYFLDNELLIISVKSAPIKGKANKEIITYLSELFSIKKSKLSIVKGLTSNNKIIKIEGMLQTQMETILSDLN